MIHLLIASGNAHKVSEIGALLGAGVRCFSWKDFALAPEVIEDAATFAGNASKKAIDSAALLAGMWAASRQPDSPLALPKLVLADDSGLEVDALGGAPGVHSARFAALDLQNKEPRAADHNTDDEANNARVLRELMGVPSERRTARF